MAKNMRWTKKDKTEWHRWFAWFPVRVKKERVWLQTVYRRHNGYGTYGHWTVNYDAYVYSKYKIWEYSFKKPRPQESK